jgi:hypothetical protein
MNTKHTQGNWTAKGNANNRYVRAHKNGFCIAEVSTPNEVGDYLTDDEAEANAKLIASAPELLQMVYDLMKCVQRLSEDGVSQENRDKEAQWIGEAHELLYKINPQYSTKSNPIEP